MTPAQCRAARALLDITQSQLGERAGVGRTTINAFETEKRSPHPSVRAALRCSLQEQGVELINGARPGVRMAIGEAA